MEKGHDRPQFELRQVHQDGSEEIGLYTLEEAASQIPGLVVGRRAFVGLAALLGSALALSGCEIFEIPPTQTPAPSNTPLPSRTSLPSRTPTLTRTITNTRTITRTGYPSRTPRLGSATPEGLVSITSSCGSIVAHTSNVEAVAFSPDGSLLATGSVDKTARVWSTRDWTIQDTVTGHTNTIYAVAFSPSEDLLATGSYDKTVRLYPYKTKGAARTLSGHTGYVYKLAFSPDGALLASAGSDKKVLIWSTRSDTSVKTLDCVVGSDYNIGLAFSPDGSLLAVSADKYEIKLWSTNDWTVYRILRGHTSTINSLAFSPDGKTLLSGANDRTVRVWDYETGEDEVLTTENTYTVAFSPDGIFFATGHSDNNIRIWSTSKKTQLYLLKAGIGGSLAFSPDGSLLANWGISRSVAVYNLTDQTPALQACLMDKNATATTVSVNSYRITVGGIERVYILPSATKVPAGATCSCVPVAGVYRAPTSKPSSGGGSICTCNKICTCIPVPKYCFVMFKEERA